MYLKVNSENFVTDCIDYPHDGYVEYVGAIPNSVHGGWHKLIDGVIVEIEELNPNNIETMKQQAIDEYTMELIELGVL